MFRDFDRVLEHGWNFYTAKFNSIVIGFSLPLILAYAVLLLAMMVTYPALGAGFLRTISIPDLSTMDFAIIAIALVLSNFVVADAITNINLLIKRKRMLSEISSEIWAGVTTYATKIFSIFIIAFLLIALFQILTFEVRGQSFIFPALAFIAMVLLFFTPPAIVIDDDDTMTAIGHSIRLIMLRPVFYLTAILLWALAGLLAITIVDAIALLVLGSQYGPFAVVLFNSVFVYPFLLILQTQLYIEKYPLAK